MHTTMRKTPLRQLCRLALCSVLLAPMSQGFEGNGFRKFSFESSNRVLGDGRVKSDNNNFTSERQLLQGYWKRSTWNKGGRNRSRGSVRYRIPRHPGAGSTDKDRTELNVAHGLRASQRTKSEFWIMPAAFGSYKFEASQSGGSGPSTQFLIFKQLHQSSPESPIVGCQLVPGKRDKMFIQYRYGDIDARKGARTRKLVDNVTMAVNRWHRISLLYRWEWNQRPGELTVYSTMWRGSRKNIINNQRTPLGYKKSNTQHRVNPFRVEDRIGIYRRAQNKEHTYLVDDIVVTKA